LNTALSNSGSGFVFSETGYIITNAHVVQSADTISVQLHDGSRYLAQVVGLDELADIALLKIPVNNLKPVVLSEKINELKVGQTVLGIGSPYSFEYSVTSGIISYLGRTLASAGVQNNSASYIQTDMLINPANSGGPIINGEGEVIGMRSRIFSTTGASIGISFGIPVNIIGQIVERLISEEGAQKSGFGLMTESINPEQIQQFGLQRNIGALITQLEPEGPAFKCGLRVNDVIVTVDGNIIRSSEEFQYQMSVLSLAEPIRVTVIRNSRYFAAHINLPDVI
jgi:serine protease Do